MPLTLHLSRETSPQVFKAILEIVQGISVSEETRRKAEVIREALYRAYRPGRENFNTPLRELKREGFEDIETAKPKEFATVAAYLEHYIQTRQPDVWKYEEFLRNGFGVFSGEKYAEQHELSFYEGRGCTDDSEHVQCILEMQRKTTPALARVPANLLRLVTGLYWD